MKRIITLLVLTAFLFAGGYSCKEKKQVAVKKAPSKKTVKAKKAVPKYTPKPYKIEVVKYNPEGRRDPFLSIIDLTKQKVEKKRKKKVNPLENYDVAEFKVLGIVYDGRQYYASVLLPDGKAFTVTKGMTVGLYDGKIIDISENQVVVREYVMNYKGQLKPKDTILKLRKEEE
ncbi:MAG: hypothetical protein D6710_03020 [Nitrospirae bacterium]|nr:MAG: hypothetical protein D6710_03020 [Nitrospirota bacterium]